MTTKIKKFLAYSLAFMLLVGIIFYATLEDYQVKRLKLFISDIFASEQIHQG